MKYYVGLPDTQGTIFWLAGYESDPTRYYTFSYALVFNFRWSAERAVRKAKKTHPHRERTYLILSSEEVREYLLTGEIPVV